MKPELTEDQLVTLDETWDHVYDENGTSLAALEAVIDLYESEMRPKDAAPIMWRKGRPPNMALYSDKVTVSDIIFKSCNYHLTFGDLLSIPFPANPTPEEKAKEEMEAAWNAKPYLHGGHRAYFEAGFMAAKFPAEGGVKL